ncbi:hypothetical protein AMP9_4632 [plant metagenome]|uniref:Transmembrane protein n=1 Tax=plant metagenome TaxID=1297885 RepID=A0A484PYH2_9ZZZZ
MNPPAASAARSLAWLPYAALALTSLLIVGGMLYYAPYGLDFTDESFYLNWLKHPHGYAYSVTQFGFIYHPLYELLSGDIATLRRINILLTFGLAWWLSSAVLRDSVAAAQADALWRPVQMLAVSAALATCVLAAFSTNHRIPNYNLLTLQALMLTTCGVLLAQRPTRSALVSGFIIGLGGTLCFVAKPTSALALCPLVLLWLAIRPRRNLPVLAVSALGATTSLASWRSSSTVRPSPSWAGCRAHNAMRSSFGEAMTGRAFSGSTHSRFTPTSCLGCTSAAQLLAATLLGMYATTPYRQPQPLWTNTEEATIGVPAAAVKVSADIGRYLRDVSDTAKKGEFQPGTAVIDMSGQSPIVPYTLGGKPGGAAWLIGGYPRSLSFAANTLRLESCEDLASAWLLREPGGPRSLADSLLDDLGLGQPDSDFDLVGEFDTPPGGGGYADPRRQQLFKPRAPQLAMENCLRKRA